MSKGQEPKIRFDKLPKEDSLRQNNSELIVVVDGSGIVVATVDCTNLLPDPEESLNRTLLYADIVSSMTAKGVVSPVIKEIDMPAKDMGILREVMVTGENLTDITGGRQRLDYIIEGGNEL